MVQACNNDGFEDPVNEAPTSEDMPWQANTMLKVTADSLQYAFIWERDLLTYNEYWKNEEVILHMKLESVLTSKQLDKVEFYINAEEKDGYNAQAPYDKANFLIETITDFNDERSFDLVIPAPTVYDLFKNKFEYNRNTQLAREGDIFEIKWVIYAKDGSVIDTRESSSIDNRFGFATIFQDFAPPVWAGDFAYEWIDMGWGISYYDPSIVIGTTGIMTIQQVDASNYTISNIHFGHSSGRAGTLYYEFDTGLVESESTLNDTWVISNIDGASLDIAFTNNWSSGYGYWGTVRLTRTDGANWPSNIHTAE
ncbi:hypothetical protein DMZ48_16410 [Robertkochia solimangrovi]|nr:hypothetical protein DMZ48_16410 [Robertkochia solimangrovi]